jgi:hypothetical protein
MEQRQHIQVVMYFSNMVTIEDVPQRGLDRYPFAGGRERTIVDGHGAPPWNEDVILLTCANRLLLG